MALVTTSPPLDWDNFVWTELAVPGVESKQTKRKNKEKKKKKLGLACVVLSTGSSSLCPCDHKEARRRCAVNLERSVLEIVLFTLHPV
jgi:hypothetical protein